MHRSIVAAGITTALLVGGGAGALLGNPLLSGAQTSPSTSVTPVEGAGDAQHHQWMADSLAPLIADGTLTQAQADAVIAALEAARPSRAHFPGKDLQALATALGMTPDEVAAALKGGQTLGQVADSQGVSREAVVDAIMAEVNAHLDQEVADGEHTQAEADQKEAEIRARITAGLDQVRPQGPGGPGSGPSPFGHGPRGHRGPDRFMPPPTPAQPPVPATTS